MWDIAEWITNISGKEQKPCNFICNYFFILWITKDYLSVFYVEIVSNSELHRF